ncbi:MAG: choice-of-anchor V domain-containing protein [Saprospiraceae bacterium]
MKSNFIYTIFICTLGSVLWMGNSLGRAAGGNANSTVSGCGNNGSCHSGGSFQGKTTITVKKNGNVITQYIPGTIYDVELTVLKTGGAGTPAGFGFQLTASKGNKDAGVFTNVAPKGKTQITTLNSRTFVEHDLLIPSGTVTVNWTAPIKGTGNVGLFAAGNLVNGVNGLQGDTPTAVTSLTLTEGAGVNTEELPDWMGDVRVIQNASVDEAHILFNSSKYTGAELAIFNLSGAQLSSTEISISEGENRIPLNIGALSPSIYLVQLQANGLLITKKVLKL